MTLVRVSTAKGGWVSGNLHCLLQDFIPGKAFTPRFGSDRHEHSWTWVSCSLLCADHFILPPVWQQNWSKIVIIIITTNKNLKNVAGRDRHGKELSQIRKGEVMFMTRQNLVQYLWYQSEKIKLWCAVFLVVCGVQLLNYHLTKSPEANGECSNWENWD